MEADFAKDLVVALPTEFKDAFATGRIVFTGNTSVYMYGLGSCRLLNRRQVSDQASKLFHGLLRLPKRAKEDKIGQNA